ncbi:MAG: hypothetical protein SVW02_04445, partial [Candidatus Nanohaloarchaea archaeon]|nr:hypothetical protein [Candidatus Nanohaloarchaea archaeon]
EVSLFGANPIALLYVISMWLILVGVYRGLSSAGGTGVTVSGLIAVILALFFIGQFVVGGWANIGGLVGEAGYAVTSALGPIGDAIGEIGARVGNQLDPRRNPNTARLVCAYELFGSGGVYKAASGGSVAMSQCVKDKLGQNETQTRSVRVTEPVELRMQEVAIEPFTDHVAVDVPLFNTFVTDIRGRPIEIEATNVKVWVTFQYLDATHTARSSMVVAEDQVGIPNGATRTISFDRPTGEDACTPDNAQKRLECFVFPSFSPQLSTVSDERIIDRIETLANGYLTYTEQRQRYVDNSCATVLEKETNNNPADDPSDSDVEGCRDTEARLRSALNDMQASSKQLSQWLNGELRPRRFAYTVKASTVTDVWDNNVSNDLQPVSTFSSSTNSQVSAVNTNIEQLKNPWSAHKNEKYLLQGREYDAVRVNYTYTYRAEAAFTQSSRWRGGNQLLKVWRLDAWQNKSFEDRQAWQDKHCAEVTKYGQNLPSKQRTAALTTPVVPVMYTGCSASLFRLFDEQKTNDIEIKVGASVNEESEVAKLMPEEKGFRVESWSQDCGTNPAGAELKPESGGWFHKKEGLGWIIDPVTVTREDVTVEGERKTIGCQTEMKIRLHARKTIQQDYRVPVIG